MRWALVVALAACGKSGDAPAPKPEPEPTVKPVKPAEPVKPVASPECVAKTKGFATWFAALKLEERSYELDFGYVLLPTERKPAPVSHHLDAIEIKESGAIGIWDVSEANHVDSPVGDKPDDAKLLEVLKTDRAKLAGPDAFDPGPDDTVRIDVDKRAPWLSVVRVAKAAREAGYGKAIFVVTAKGVAERPTGTDEWTTLAEVHDAASKAVEDAGKTCKPFGRAMMHWPDGKLTPEQDTAAWGAKVEAAFVECNCVPDVHPTKQLIWQATRWHQATPRAGVTVLLADGTILSQASTVPWSEAAKTLLDAAPEGQPPPAVSFELAKR